MADVAELPPGATVALLSLRLRTTLQEASDAEAELAAIDVDAALAQLRARLTPLIDERRRSLATELANEQLRCAGEVAAAHHEAARILGPAVAADEPEHDSDDLESESAIVVDVIEPLPLPDPTALPRVGPSSDPTASSDVELWRPASELGGDRAMQLFVDHESFARAFAEAIAPLLEAQRHQSPPSWMSTQAPPAKRSFWAHSWHPDVLLSGFAMVIVIIVLVAWTG